MEAWDGWCNYGIVDDPNISFVVPEEGSDLWTDTMVVLDSSGNKEAAHAFINYILDPAVHTWVVENILYKVPNQAAMEALDPSLIEAYPNLDRASELKAVTPVLGFSFNETTASDGWGAMNRENWQAQIEIYSKLGQFEGPTPGIDDVMTLDILEATAADRAKVG